MRPESISLRSQEDIIWSGQNIASNAKLYKTISGVNGYLLVSLVTVDAVDANDIIHRTFPGERDSWSGSRLAAYTTPTLRLSYIIG